jgi:hypothetical protein
VSPALEPFDRLRYAVQEVSVLRYRMPVPKVGDIIERDYEQCRITRVSVREATARDVETLSARPDLGDRMLWLEYEYVEPEQPR